MREKQELQEELPPVTHEGDPFKEVANEKQERVSDVKDLWEEMFELREGLKRAMDRIDDTKDDLETLQKSSDNQIPL